MTVQEMARKILDFVDGWQPATFYELIEHLGTEAKGDQAVEIPTYPNVWAWDGVSSKFIDALNLIKSKLCPNTTDPLVYLMDGGILNLPIAKKIAPYKTPHWLPVTLNIRTETAQREIDVAKH
ncbi:MAG TPA: hypothetical protein VLA42_11100 [Verrucomicrobiae bacterium]|jgi:hypothetical protein|nr:hypothetical protein [Verrucomicrobiae bacterium]